MNNTGKSLLQCVKPLAPVRETDVLTLLGMFVDRFRNNDYQFSSITLSSHHCLIQRGLHRQLLLTKSTDQILDVQLLPTQHRRGQSP